MKTRYIPAIILFVIAAFSWVVGYFFLMTEREGGMGLMVLGVMFAILAAVALVITVLMHKFMRKNTNPLP